MNTNPTNFTVTGLRKIMAYYEVQIEIIELGNEAISLTATKYNQVVYNEVISESDLHLNKESECYLNYKSAYVKARAAKYIYHKLLEKQLIQIRLPKKLLQ